MTRPGIASAFWKSIRAISGGDNSKAICMPNATRFAALALGWPPLLCTFLLSWPVGVSAAEPAPCRAVAFAEGSFTVCTFDLRQTDLRLHWKDSSGEAYGSLGAFVSAEQSSKPPLVFAMNAGMYQADASPVGLYVEAGEQLRKANTANGPGNFHLKPNGIFYIRGDQAGVLETGRFLKHRPKADYATQSGPMLVIDGKVHPRFSATSQSYKIRNGVGVSDPHTVVFAISNQTVTFLDFARLFRDELKCPNALFLDGSISSLYAPSAGRADTFWPVGPIVSARARAK